MHKNYTKKDIIDLIEWFSKTFYYSFLIFCFFFWNIFLLLILYFRIFNEKKYNVFLNIIKDLKDENENRINSTDNWADKEWFCKTSYDNEDDFEEDEYGLNNDDFEENLEEDEYEDDKREIFVYNYIKNWLLISYFSYWITIFSTIYLFFWDNLIFFILFLIYCILYKQLFNFLFWFQIKIN